MKTPPRIALITLITLFAATAFPFSKVNASVIYSAHFTLKKEPLKLIIHREPAGSSAQILAANGALQARCEVRHLERDESDKPLAVDMDCRSASFTPLTSKATLFWPAGVASSAATLRFGTWLDGYEQVRLSVNVDRYSQKVSRAPSVFRHKPIKFQKVAQAN